MEFYKYSIEDDGAFAGFVSTMENAGAEIDGSTIMFESDNAPAKMLAESLVEYNIITPLTEATKPTAPAKGKVVQKPNNNPDPKTEGQPEGNGVPAKDDSPAGKSTPDDGGNGEPGAHEKSENPGDVVAKEPEQQQNENPDKKQVYSDIIEKIDSLGLNDSLKRLIETKITKYVDGLAEKKPEIYTKLADDPMNIGKLVFGVIQKTNPQLFEKLKESGALNDKGENAASMAQKTELAKSISQIIGQIEVPDAFNVEVDDSEWENALITGFGFPMINLTSPLVRDMLRTQDPSQQKRSYKEFKKQLKSDPDVAKALGIGVLGTLGFGGREGAKTDTKARIDTKTESVVTDGQVLVEGAITDIKNALKNPVEVLKSIAQNKGTPCRRNNLVVMYEEIDGKSGDSNDNVTVIPLGVSGGVLVDKNKSVSVPMVHLSTFYSVVDPRASFKSYAKAMAEVNTKSDNANKGIGDAAAAAGKKLLSKIPLLGRSAKKELEGQQSDALTGAMGELAMYIKENGHPPFYLLKPKSEPKEIDRWSDEDAANGYQMITMNVDGHKAGMILKESTAEALFKVG